MSRTTETANAVHVVTCWRAQFGHGPCELATVPILAARAGGNGRIEGGPPLRCLLGAEASDRADCNNVAWMYGRVSLHGVSHRGGYKGRHLAA
jgi:hypothetical protein